MNEPTPSGGEGNARVCWIDELSGGAVVKLSWLCLARRNEPIGEVRHLASTASGRRLLSLLAPALSLLGSRVAARSVDFDLYALRDTTSNDSTYEIDRGVDEVMDRLSKRVIAQVDLQSLLERRLKRPYNGDRLRLYLERTAAYELYRPVLSLDVMHRLAARSDRSKPASHLFLVQSPPFGSRLVEECPPTVRSRVETYNTFREARRLLHAVGALAKRLVSAAAAPARRSSARSHGGPGPRVGVQFTQGIDLDTRSDIFWLPPSGLSPERVMVYFGRRRFPGSEEAFRRLDGMGIGHMVMRNWHPGSRDLKYLRHVFGATAVAMRLVWYALTGRSSIGWWLWRVLTDLETRIGYWSAFLREQNIGVHIHYAANNPGAIARVLAAEQEGRIDIGYQLSSSDFIQPVRGRIVANHVYFTWGAMFVDQIAKSRMSPDALVVGGHVFGHLAQEARCRALERRRTLLGNGCEYLICLFDNSFSREIVYTPGLMEDFYRTVLQWVLADRTLGLIVKPKSSFETMLPGAVAMVREATERGQCIVTEGSVSSFEGALSADVAVGVGVNTAVLDAAIAGVPAVHLDLSGMTNAYPFYSEGRGRFIFRHGDDLFRKIAEHRQGRPDRSSFGDHGCHLEGVDPFRDGKGARRMGTYIRWLIEAMEEGKPGREAVKKASERYAQQVGPEYVVSGIGTQTVSSKKDKAKS